MGNLLCLVQVDQSTVAIKETFGKFDDVLEPGCHCVPWIFGSRLAGHLTLRVQQLDVKCETKTKDNVFVNVVASIQYRALSDKASDAFYKLSNTRAQIQAYVFDVIRASVPKLNLDDAFEQKNDIAKAVEDELEKAMSAYGFEIVQTLIVDGSVDCRRMNIYRLLNRLKASVCRAKGYREMDNHIPKEEDNDINWDTEDELEIQNIVPSSYSTLVTRNSEAIISNEELHLVLLHRIHFMDLQPPHVLIFPFPAQGHVNAMLKLTELLLPAGLHITFLISSKDYRSLCSYATIHSRLNSKPGFRFHVIESLYEGNMDTGEKSSLMVDSLAQVATPLLRKLILDFPVTCVIDDGINGFSLDAVEGTGIPVIFFRTISACAFWAYFSIPELVSSGELPFTDPSGGDEESLSKTNVCSSVSNGTMCCDRTSIRSDVCVMKGDIRTHSSSFSVFLYTSKNSGAGKEQFRREKIRPYTRKWESSTMATIDELTLITMNSNTSTTNNQHKCDVNHDVPAVFFSTGGYTGNVYHEFNDGLIPLYITSQKYNKKVVFVILEYHDWWITKYANILTHLSDFEPIDFSGDKRTHCFKESVIGLRIHDELTVDSSLMEGSKTIGDFRDILDKGYKPRIEGLIQEERENVRLKNPIRLAGQLDKPKLVIISRNGSRAIMNENVLVKMASKIGFSVTVLKPQRTSELAKIYRELNSSDVMVSVHGAAMTHFLFMKPGSVFIQVVPLGTTWAAENYYGEPAKKLGLRYIGYEILPRESSLYEEYESNDPVLRDPFSVNDRGWEFTKKIYLDRQKVRLNLARFRKRLVRSYIYTMKKRNEMVLSQ